MLLTVFTPTYNRAYTLSKLYESLTRQTVRDFEWLIVDDGSTDSTSELVKRWALDEMINIRYIRKENGGKSSAHNVGVREARGELFICVDSDDYLANSAVEIIRNAWAVADADNVGVVAYKALNNGKSVTDIKDKNVLSFTLKDGYDAYGLTGDTALVFKTEAVRRFEFPSFEGETFVPEGYLYDKIDTLGTLLVVREPIYICEYLDDGYTANMKRTLYKNPTGYFAYIENRLKIDKTFKHKLLDSIRYMAMAIAHKRTRKVRSAPYPWIALMAYLPGLALYARDFKRYKDE